MTPSQLPEQIQAKITAFGQDRRKVVIIAGVVAGLMIIGLLITILLPGGTSQINQNELTEATIEPTYTEEEIEALTLAPAKPTDIPFIVSEDVKSTPTPTPLPGKFFVPDGTHNDLTIYLDQVNEGDIFDEVRLVSLRTKEERLLGFTYDLAPGDSAFFSSDYSQVIFLGGAKLDHQKINVYSILQDKIIKSISLDQMKQSLSALKIDSTSTLSSMMPSPSKTKVAISYGLTFNTTPIHPETQIIVINLTNNRMRLLPVKGLVKQWKDETTLEYEVPTADPNVRSTQQVTIGGI